MHSSCTDFKLKNVSQLLIYLVKSWKLDIQQNTSQKKEENVRKAQIGVHTNYGAHCVLEYEMKRNASAVWQTNRTSQLYDSIEIPLAPKGNAFLTIAWRFKCDGVLSLVYLSMVFRIRGETNFKTIHQSDTHMLFHIMNLAFGISFASFALK